MAAFYILEQLRRLPLKKMPNYKIIVQQQRHKERFIIIMISGVTATAENFTVLSADCSQSPEFVSGSR